MNESYFGIEGRVIERRELRIRGQYLGFLKGLIMVEVWWEI